MWVQGYKSKAIAESVGLDAKQTRKILREYRHAGVVVKPKVCGRKLESGMLLSVEQESELRRILVDKTPEQMKFSFALWTREAVCQLIEQKYGIKFSLRCATNYLKRWGMTCQRPTKRAYRQDNIKVEKFKRDTYPAIKARAMAEKGEIYWGDETGIDNREHYQRGFAVKGNPPVIPVESKRERVNMVSAINNYGTLRFMFYDEKMTQQRFIEFMKRLVADAKGKVFLIVDNLKVHHGIIVTKWLAENKDEIELFFIPPYSPELNPDEYLNHALKLDVHRGVLPRTKSDITQKAAQFMNNLKANAERVRAFFHHKNLSYQYV